MDSDTPLDGRRFRIVELEGFVVEFHGEGATVDFDVTARIRFTTTPLQLVGVGFGCFARVAMGVPG